MPITDDGFTPYTKDEIHERLISDFENRFDTTVTPGQLVEKQLEAEAETLATYQEQALAEVYNSAYLSSATGDELDKLVERIGLSRQQATPSTGVVDFISDSVPSNDYTIPSGTVVQTGGSAPVKFETTSTAYIRHVDGFSDGNTAEWTGDDSSFSVVTHNGEDALEIPASNGVSIHRTSPTIQIGTTLNVDIDLTADTSKAIRLRVDEDNYYEATFDVGASDLHLEIVDGGSTVDSSSTNVSIPTETTHVEWQWDVTGVMTVTLYDTASRENAIDSVTLTDSDVRWLEADIEIASLDATDVGYVMDIATTRTSANVEGQSGGVETNVGPNTISVMPSPPTGVSRVTNPLATGDSSYQGVTGVSFVLGQNRESDDELRTRAYDSSSIGGAATVDAIGSAIRGLESVNSVRVFQNKTPDDNTGSGGLPPHSFEVAVHGGIDEEVANTIFDTKAIDSRDYGGAHGTAKSYTVTSDVLETNETINWTEVPEMDLHITLDIIVDSTYVGDEEIQSRIVEYIGGTDVDGSIVAGTEVGEDIYESVVIDQVVDPNETGVWEVDSITIDKDGDGTDDTETLGNGADVLAISDDEIAVTSGRDGSITINTSQK